MFLSAIEDAKVNAQLNNITNALFFGCDMKDVLNQKFLENIGPARCGNTDPPRAGMHEDV